MTGWQQTAAAVAFGLIGMYGGQIGYAVAMIALALFLRRLWV
jgi:hypothetical protein